jgi:hypothetical protein
MNDILKSIRTSDIHVGQLTLLLTIEIGLGLLFIYYFYPVFSMMAFGEGANSFMYSETNGVLMFLIPYLLTTTFNLKRLRTEYKNQKDFRKMKLYSVTTILVTIIYPIGGLWIWNY